MKCMERNKVPFYYCLYDEEVPIVDSEGNETGEKTISYSDPVEIRANISPATGNTSVEQFGNSLQYDKVIVLDDLTCPIDENSVLFIDTAPAFDTDGNPLFDYIVKKVARSLNSISIAIAKVEVS
mgnify:CR=1 FL=1|jgi:hypothetical protein